MKKYHVLIYGLAICLFVFGQGFNVFAADLKQSPSTGTSSQASRVGQFLAELQKVHTADQAAKLMKRANLDAGELKQVSTELSKPSWAVKLDAIKRSGQRSSHPPTPRKFQGQSSQKVLADLQSNLEQRRAGIVTTKKQTFQAKLNAARSAARPAPVRTVSMGSGMVMAVKNPYAGDPDTAASINSVDPDTAVVGQTVTIRGQRFGNTRGQVVVRTETDIFPCEILTWSSQSITVRIPQSICSWSSMRDVPPDVHEEDRGVTITSRGSSGSSGDRFLPATSRHVYLWVKLAGGETGPWRQIVVSADVSLLMPTITAVSPTELEPGSDLLIEGRNFGDQPNPNSSWMRLHLMFSQDIPFEVREWHDGYIVAGISRNISGVQPMSGGIVKVSNRLALEAVKGGLSFTPEMETQEIEKGLFHSQCHPQGCPPLCLIGDTNYFDAYNIQLRNGWTVYDKWIEIIEDRSMGPNYGCYFERTPEVGSTNLQTRVVAWADAYSMVECRAHVIVRGPKGTSYR